MGISYASPHLSYLLWRDVWDNEVNAVPNMYRSGL